MLMWHGPVMPNSADERRVSAPVARSTSYRRTAVPLGSLTNSASTTEYSRVPSRLKSTKLGLGASAASCMPDNAPLSVSSSKR